MDYMRMVALFMVLGLFATQVVAALTARKALARVRPRGR